MGIDGVKFRKPVEPGVLLDLHVTILQAKRNICKFEGNAMLNGALAAECQFTAMIADPPSN
jgi:3-hydroxyacyl-[acyl-carrier-protein] dehydratase